MTPLYFVVPAQLTPPVGISALSSASPIHAPVTSTPIFTEAAEPLTVAVTVAVVYVVPVTVELYE